MASKSAIDILKRILLSFRRNWGLKLLSLLFATILWNYVIVEIDPVRPQPYKVPITPTGLTQLKNNSLTVTGDIYKRLQDIMVTVGVDLKRSDASRFNSNNIQVTADFSNITHDGEIEVQLKAYLNNPAIGTVKSISPSTLKVKIEKRVIRLVPVSCTYINSLPPGDWMDDPEYAKTLEIKGAISEINKVTHATVEVDLAKLKQGITSAALNYKLWAGDTEIIDTTGLEYSPNGIVSLKVLRKKTVTVDAAGSLVGDVAKGYGVESAVSDPATIEIAGPENIIKDIESLRTTAINIDGATGTQSITTQVKLPPGVRAIYNNDTVDVTVTIRENKKTVTLDNLPVYITGLGEGLKVDAKFRATAVVTCSELAAPGIRASKIRLFVDATGMEAGSHTLTILYETADGLKVDEIRVNPTEIPVLIKAATAP